MNFKEVEISIKASNSPKKYVVLNANYKHHYLLEAHKTPIGFNASEQLITDLKNSISQIIETITGDKLENAEDDDEE